MSVLRDFYDDTTEDAYLMQFLHRPAAPELVPVNRITRLAGYASSGNQEKRHACLFALGPLELIILGVVVFVPVAAVVALVVALYSSRKSLKDNPNLRPCPDCGQSVSLRATACPKCGCPLET